MSCAECEDTLIPVETMEADSAESLGHHYTGQGGGRGPDYTLIYHTYILNSTTGEGGVTGADIKGMTV